MVRFPSGRRIPVNRGIGCSGETSCPGRKGEKLAFSRPRNRSLAGMACCLPTGIHGECCDSRKRGILGYRRGNDDSNGPSSRDVGFHSRGANSLAKASGRIGKVYRHRVFAGMCYCSGCRAFKRRTSIGYAAGRHLSCCGRSTRGTAGDCDYFSCNGSGENIQAGCAGKKTSCGRDFRLCQCNLFR